MKTAVRKHLGDFMALIALFVIAIGVTGYILSHQDARSASRFEATPFTVKAEFSDGPGGHSRPGPDRARGGRAGRRHRQVAPRERPRRRDDGDRQEVPAS